MRTHPARRARFTLALASLWAVALAGCASTTPPAESRIPEFARPQLLEGVEERTGDLIGYRALARDDFAASGPPVAMAANAQRLGAATCASIRIRPDARFAVREGGPEVEVEAEGVAFEALFDRGCSWWNDANDTLPEAYVLEHEQIHFALFEIEARNLTRRAVKAVRMTAPRGTPARVLIERVQGRIDAELSASADAVLARSLRFDEDTSFEYRPKVQGRWRAAVERELAELPAAPR